MAENKFSVDKYIKNNLDIIKGSTSTFFTGVDDMISSARMDPLVTGYSFFRIIDAPSWLSEDPDLKYFVDLINKNTKGFSGISDIELQTATHQTGFAGSEAAVVTGITRGNTEFTLTHKEYSGTPMIKAYTKLISLIRDPRTGLALYPSVYNVEYGQRNHTFTCIYMTCKPSLLNAASDDSVIEHAIFYSNAVPLAIPLADAFGSWESGSNDSPEITVNWSAFPETGPDVEALALKVLRDDILNISADGNGIPFVDSLSANKDAVSLQNSGWLKDIYNPEK